MKKYHLYLKNKGSVIIGFLCICIIFLAIRVRVNSKIDFMAVYYQTYNERRFLSIYVPLFLLIVFCSFKEIYRIEIITKSKWKWKYFMNICKKIFCFSILYSIMTSIGWYFIVGMVSEGWKSRENQNYIMIILITQIVGWSLIGIFEMSVYLMIKNFPLTFLICDTVLIILNLSLYVSSNEKYIHYVRIYDFMFDFLKNKNIFFVLSIGFLYITIIGILVCFNYFLLKRHDFVGGVRQYDGREK